MPRHLVAVSAILSLSALPFFPGDTSAQLNSASQTPASSVLPVPDEKRQRVDWTNYRLHPYPLQGVTSKTVRGKQVNIIELRGWLRKVGAEGKEGERPGEGHCDDGSGPDIAYDLELDPLWDHQAIQLDKLLWIGNIISMADPWDIGDEYRAMGTPFVHGELHSYDREKPISNLVPEPPDGWRNIPPCQDQPDKVFWPFDPYKPLPDKPELRKGKYLDGQYVRMVGSLITDAPHEGQSSRSSHWTIGDGKDPHDPARWVEMHSPDIVEVLEDKPREATLKGVAVFSDHCLTGPCNVTAIETLIPAPPKPNVPSSLQVKEYVLYNNRVEENKPTLRVEGLQIKVRVRGESAMRKPGKFAALYVLWWIKRPIGNGIGSFQSMNFPQRFIRHQHSVAVLSERDLSNRLDVEDSSFIIVPGLADPAGMSFESFNYPDHYLRHENFQLKLAPKSEDQQFRQDATFFQERGLAEHPTNVTSYRSFNFPDRYIRHRQFQLFLDRDTGGSFKADATFFSDVSPVWVEK
jgi:hypothetical protein